MEDMSKWVLDPGNTRGRHKKYLNSTTLHWKMKTLLGLVLRDKQVKKYNIYASIEDVKRMLRNLRFCVETIATHLMCVKNPFLVIMSEGRNYVPLALVHGIR